MSRVHDPGTGGRVEAVILAGGMGTRLRGVIGARQKVAVSIDGRTTLDRLLSHLEESGRIGRVVVCAGFDADGVRDVVASWGGQLPVDVVAENAPLGTGGALRGALDLLTGDRFVVMNGDSFFPVSIAALLTLHEARGASVTLSAAHVEDPRRFGRLDLTDDGGVRAFIEKGSGGADRAWINGGVYVVERVVIASLPAGEARSLEHDVLAPLAGTRLWALRWPGPFIDIGTPESLAQASEFFRLAEDARAHERSDVLVVLDRDGTLIEERHYLSDPEAVALIPGAADAVRVLTSLPSVVTVMSNQAGVGRGYFDEDAVRAVNARLVDVLQRAGSAVDAVYYCPHAPDAACACRKPARGMIDRAVSELSIAPAQTFVIGDNHCDMDLARNVGGYGILVGTGHGASVQREATSSAHFMVKDITDAATLVEMLVHQHAWQRALASGGGSTASASLVSPC